MNIALEKTEEYVNGGLRHKYGDAFVRGNNGLSAHLPLVDDVDGASAVYLCAMRGRYLHGLRMGLRDDSTGLPHRRRRGFC